MNEPLRIALIGAGVMGRQHCRRLLREPLARLCANPNALYVSTVLDCIAAGVPVLLEKPVGASLAEAEPLVGAADATRTLALLEAVMQAAESGRSSRPALAGEP